MTGAKEKRKIGRKGYAREYAFDIYAKRIRCAPDIKSARLAMVAAENCKRLTFEDLNKLNDMLAEKRKEKNNVG